MRTLVHLSDLHFGRVDQQLLAPLIRLVQIIAPDVLVVSGDLTQRAKSAEFIAARVFLDTLPTPQIIVPGNHDIPLHNLVTRFLQPLAKYTRFITTDLTPFHADAEIAVIGINTARSLTVKDGRINHAQMDEVKARLASLPPEVIRVIVTHHPFDLPASFNRNDLVGRAPAALKAFATSGADLLLAGHLHASHAGTTTVNHPIAGFSALAVQAGTATSTRGRGEANSFNVIRTQTNAIAVERFAWDDAAAQFMSADSQAFHREGNCWQLDAVP